MNLEFEINGGDFVNAGRASEKVDLIMGYISPKGRWKLDTKQIKQELGIERLDDMIIKKSIKEMINNNITKLEPTN
ncbi:MAG: hypothetical protein K9J25_08050 [Bacteroidales bacterium]|nr:hypothetical protein [Bacteroidales bacterium]